MDSLAAAVQEFATSTVLALDLIGTFVFALSGAIVGVRQRLDMFGVLVLSFAASSAGGIMRDVLIGSVPPAAIEDWRYLIAALIAGLLIFLWLPRYLQSSKCNTSSACSMPQVWDFSPLPARKRRWGMG